MKYKAKKYIVFQKEKKTNEKGGIFMYLVPFTLTALNKIEMNWNC